MIYYDEGSRSFKLDTAGSSYICQIVDGKYLGHVYYGRYVEQTDLGYLLRTEEEPWTPAVCSREKVTFLDSFPMEYSFGKTGDFRESCIDITTENGQEGLELHYLSHRIYAGRQPLEGLPAAWGDNCDTLEITLRDGVTGLQVLLSYVVFRDLDVITRNVRVINDGSAVLYLNRLLSACLDMDNEDFDLITLPGAWARERHIQRRSLGHGSFVGESLKGQTSHQEQPFAALVSPGCNQKTGEVYAMQLVYSGNFMTKVSVNQFDSVRVVMGIHPERFRWRLAPGESFQSPEAILVYSAEGLGHMTRTLHRFYREHFIRSPWKEWERPVLINNWEATYFDFNKEKLLDIAREAAKAGIEMLVMDDGWFGRRNHDDCSLGDWYVNEEKLPGGLAGLTDAINELGMKFGIWLEPEMISEDSDLYRAHSDWALVLRGRTPSLCRQQLVLDLSRPEVADYVYSQIKAVLSSANIAYVKWDMNRPLADVGNAVLPPDRQGEIMHRYVLAVYEMQEKLLRDFPDLLLENCCGGGGRFDPGMLYYSPQIWCSDDTDAIERLSIQEGTALIYPMSAMGAHVSDCPNHITGRQTPFDTRGIVALAGTFGYELDITKISEAERAAIPQQIALYKKYHSLIARGDYYRLASYSDNHYYDCYEIVAPDQSQALVTYVQVLAEPNKKSRRIRLEGLDAEAWYEVEGRRYQGRTLMHAGLLMERMKGDFQAKLLELRRI